MTFLIDDVVPNHLYTNRGISHNLHQTSTLLNTGKMVYFVVKAFFIKS